MSRPGEGRQKQAKAKPVKKTSKPGKPAKLGGAPPVPEGTTDAAMDIIFPNPGVSPINRTLEPHQRPPTDPFDLWVLQAGRGAGKTEACSHYFATYMHQNPGARGRIIAPTLGDAVEACIDGP